MRARGEEQLVGGKWFVLMPCWGTDALCDSTDVLLVLVCTIWQLLVYTQCLQIRKADDGSLAKFHQSHHCISVLASTCSVNETDG